MHRLTLASLALLTALSAGASTPHRDRIDLAGTWNFALDRDTTMTVATMLQRLGNETATLPGTTDTNRKGTPLARFDETTHLSRRFAYTGRAWYSREVSVPKEWRAHTIMLHLERTKHTTVFVDDRLAGTCNDISTPQDYDLTQLLTPGRHTITIIVDNGGGIPPQTITSSHACSEDTQTNWNGIIGNLYIEARPLTGIADVCFEGGNANPACSFRVEGKGKLKGGVTVTVADTRTGFTVFTAKTRGNYIAREAPYSIALGALAGKLDEWSDYSPSLYRLTVAADNGSSATTTFGIADFKASAGRFTINGRTTFLRGKHDAAVFPLTGHAPADRKSWDEYFATMRQYGINHVRFHSWCPPEACFEAADSAGIYLQPELPFWGDFNAADTCLMQFLHKEGLNIVRRYGKHPSFVMMALGNELWGSEQEMKRFADDFRAADSTIAYTLGTNCFLGYKGELPGMDFIATCRLGGEAWGDYSTHTRSSFSFADADEGGLINHEYPNTTTTFDNATRNARLPVVSHETGQYQCFPNFREMPQYKGVLRPCNMETFARRLAHAGMGDQADDFFRASGLWAVELYKADIEMCLRSRGIAGFQLLDLQDYPGQGSAYVGILDAFLQSKHLVTPERWRGWCSSTVPMLELPRYCFTDGERITAKAVVASYAAPGQSPATLHWRLADSRGNTRAEGRNAIAALPDGGIADAGNLDIAATLGSSGRSERLTLSVDVEGTAQKNSYPIWIYPRHDFDSELAELSKGITVADTLTADLAAKLEKGAKVLLMPREGMYARQTVGGLFATDYWNFRMFSTICKNNGKSPSPGTLGLLTNPHHPLFNSFATEEHTNWQWFDIVKHSRPFILDASSASYRPIVQVIDNVERNHKLGIVFEWTVGKGKLLVCMADLRQASAHAEGREFWLSMLRYMQSGGFNPENTATPAQLMQLLTSVPDESNTQELRNISYD